MGYSPVCVLSALLDLSVLLFVNVKGLGREETGWGIGWKQARCLRTVIVIRNVILPVKWCMTVGLDLSPFPHSLALFLPLSIFWFLFSLGPLFQTRVLSTPISFSLFPFIAIYSSLFILIFWSYHRISFLSFLFILTPSLSLCLSFSLLLSLA